MPPIEKTYIMIKPDAVIDRKIGEIITRIERSGLTSSASTGRHEPDVVREHYAHLADKRSSRTSWPSSSGPVVKMVDSGLGAIGKMAPSWAPPTRSTPRRGPSAATLPST